MKLVKKFKRKRKGFQNNSVTDQEVVQAIENDVCARKIERQRIFFRATITFAFQAVIVGGLGVYFTANSARYKVEYFGSFAATAACLIALQFYF